jgi:two-component system nitrate/nitrite response regulator NarL
VGVDNATVLVVDDHPIVRRGVTALLTVEPWVARVVEATTIRRAQEVAVTERPDVAVVDLGLPDGSGLDLLPRLRRVVPDCALLVFTMSREEATVRACLAAGARGYLLKDSDPTVIISSIRAVLDGGLVLGPAVAAAAVGGGSPAALPPALARLSPTELRMLAMVARGARNAEIATALDVAEKTVRNRLTRVLAAIGAADRVQAALIARDAGLHRTGTR